MSNKVRVRFCPSPTGDPHVGMVRTALFNWAFARHNNGTFVFRIEDTDTARDSEESYQALLDSMRWLGLNWDEGPEVGGAFGPYRQSERMDIYKDIAQKLFENKFAYHCYCTQDEVEERRKAQKEKGQTPGYDAHCRELGDAQIQDFKSKNREPVLRFRMPGKKITWQDLVRGELSFDPEHIPDYVLVRANGDPLYTLVNPADDALMQITHVLRGEDLLSSTPRQIALYEAFKQIGVGTGVTPEFGHLPYVMGEGNKKLSKRDPESSLLKYRREGFLPEGLLNYLALLGWSFGDDIEFFSMKEMADNFDLNRVSTNPARFDIKKCTAINADWIRKLSTEELAHRMENQLVVDKIIPAIPTQGQKDLILAATPLVQERLETLSQTGGMLSFLLVTETEFKVDHEDAEKSLTHENIPVLVASLKVIESINDFKTQILHDELNKVLVQEMGLKPRVAFTALRVAVTGRRVSPPLFESMELLGKEKVVKRISQQIPK
jgi:glutamyl-tRNA synthetase